MQAALIAAIVTLYLVPFLITMLKGKFWLGLISMGIGGMFLTVPGATRLAKPDPWWALRFYDSGKLARARTRFEGGSASLPMNQAALPPMP
jgi:hypothetical protein